MAFRQGTPWQPGKIDTGMLQYAANAKGQAGANIGNALVGAAGQYKDHKDQQKQYKDSIASAMAWAKTAKTMKEKLPPGTVEMMDGLQAKLSNEEIPLSQRAAIGEQFSSMNQALFGAGIRQAMGAGGSDQPSSVREYEYFSQLDEDKQAQFMNLKRAQPGVKLVEIGGKKGVMSPDGKISFLSTVEEEAGAEARVAGARTEATERKKAEVQRELDDPKQRQAAELAVNSAENVIQTAEDAMGLSNGFTTGPMGLLRYVPTTDARTLNNRLDTIKASLAFDKLQSMREASQTGGALGQVSNNELNLLESSVAKLDQLTSEEELDDQLSKIVEHYNTFKISVLARRYREISEQDKSPEEINQRMIAEFGRRTAMNIRGMFLEKEMGMKPEEVKKQLKKEFNIGQ